MLRLERNRQIASALALALVAGASTGTAAPPGVDTEASSPVTNVSREELERLPTGRDIADLIRTCPSQTIPTVASGPRTLIDGVPTTPTPSIACIRPDDLRMVQVYQLHNSERSRYGYQPLVWNPVLAANAQTYANQLAQTGQLAHASREGRGTERENLSQGLPGWTSYQMMGSWLDERPYFKAGIFPDVSTTGDWYRVGHYSQMIWPTTTDLGCGISAGGAFSWLVCRYNPGGNKDGKPVGFPMQTQQMAAGTGAADTAAPFVNDRWRLNDNWSFNLGVRYDESSPPPSHDLPERRASLFDLGIYGGGAYTTDWFETEPESDPQNAAPGRVHSRFQLPVLFQPPSDVGVLYFLTTESFGEDCLVNGQFSFGRQLEPYVYPEVLNVFSEELTNGAPTQAAFDRLDGEFQSPREYRLGCRLRF